MHRLPERPNIIQRFKLELGLPLDVDNSRDPFSAILRIRHRSHCRMLRRILLLHKEKGTGGAVGTTNGNRYQQSS